MAAGAGARTARGHISRAFDGSAAVGPWSGSSRWEAGAAAGAEAAAGLHRTGITPPRGTCCGASAPSTSIDAAVDARARPDRAPAADGDLRTSSRCPRSSPNAERIGDGRRSRADGPVRRVAAARPAPRPPGMPDPALARIQHGATGARCARPPGSPVARRSIELDRRARELGRGICGGMTRRTRATRAVDSRPRSC